MLLVSVVDEGRTESHAVGLFKSTCLEQLWVCRKESVL